MSCSPPSPAAELALSLIEGLKTELYLSPKPGLVDRLDNGSHPDLSLAAMEASIELFEYYLCDLIRELDEGDEVEALIRIGRNAEERMFRHLGTNTHKGAIFLGGLLVCARARVDTEEPRRLRLKLAELAGRFFERTPARVSNGERVRRRLGRSGVVGEALCGLPSLFDLALPAWGQAQALGWDERRSRFFMMARLMQQVEDTTALHRCGEAGLARLRGDGRRIEELMLRGCDPAALLSRLNGEYRALNLTMGGVADLLGIASGYLLHLRNRVQAPEALPAMAAVSR